MQFLIELDKLLIEHLKNKERLLSKFIDIWTKTEITKKERKRFI